MIFGIFCYSEKEYIKALKKIEISIKSITKIKKSILFLGKNLSLDLDKLQIEGIFKYSHRKKNFQDLII